ncbi:hypothetical protein [Pacificibacter marinus]|nr:hypothetical protein [Pacificibacter marinus]
MTKSAMISDLVPYTVMQRSVSGVVIGMRLNLAAFGMARGFGHF